MPQTVLRIRLDTDLLLQAAKAGPLDQVIDAALRQVVSPQEHTRRRRWAEDNALLVEAAMGAEEARAQ